MTAVMGGRASEARDPLSRDVLFRQVGTLTGAVLLGFLAMALREVDTEATGPLVQASTITAGTVILTLLVPWHRLPHPLHTVVPFVFLAVAYLAREATGGADSAYAQLALLPVFWVAVYGTRLELCGVMVAAFALLATPLLAEGEVGQAWVRTAPMVVGGGAVALLVHRFFTGIRRQSDRLHVFAGTDPLTGAANRRAWDAELASALVRTARGGVPLSMALIDLDEFKGYNDRNGHQAGDRLLKESAAAWRGILRASDVLARIGGDEFAVLLPGCPLDMAASIADRLRTAVPAAHCSVGVALWDGQESAVGLQARADRALYDAKEAGRDRVEIISATDGLHIEVVEDAPRHERHGERV